MYQGVPDDDCDDIYGAYRSEEDEGEPENGEPHDVASVHDLRRRRLRERVPGVRLSDPYESTRAGIEHSACVLDGDDVDLRQILSAAGSGADLRLQDGAVKLFLTEDLAGARRLRRLRLARALVLIWGVTLTFMAGLVTLWMHGTSMPHYTMG